MALWGPMEKKKGLARTACITCSACGEKQRYLIFRLRVWRALLGLPLLPLSTRYGYCCPACGNSHPLEKKQAKRMARQARRTQGRDSRPAGAGAEAGNKGAD